LCCNSCYLEVGTAAVRLQYRTGFARSAEYALRDLTDPVRPVRTDAIHTVFIDAVQIGYFDRYIPAGIHRPNTP
jgi:hypothetical protein